jgi:RHS repeat-associated protein
VLGKFTPDDDIYYLLGLDIIGQQRDTDWSYFAYDALGSVRMMTGAGGGVTNRSNYDPYGVPIEQSGVAITSLGFTGQYTDPSGLLYLRARYANLSTATFLTMDPVQGVVGGQSVRWNPYLYVGGNPVNYIDPDGQFFFALAAGALAGAAFSGRDQHHDVDGVGGESLGVPGMVSSNARSTEYQQVVEALLAVA